MFNLRQQGPTRAPSAALGNDCPESVVAKVRPRNPISTDREADIIGPAEGPAADAIPINNPSNEESMAKRIAKFMKMPTYKTKQKQY